MIFSVKKKNRENHMQTRDRYAGDTTRHGMAIMVITETTVHRDMEDDQT